MEILTQEKNRNTQQAVRCILCGNEYAFIHWSHLRRAHNIYNQAEYRKEFGIAEADRLCSADYSEIRAKIGQINGAKGAITLHNLHNRKDEILEQFINQGLWSVELASELTGIGAGTIAQACTTGRLSHALACIIDPTIISKERSCIGLSHAVRLISATDLLNYKRSFTGKIKG